MRNFTLIPIINYFHFSQSFQITKLLSNLDLLKILAFTQLYVVCKCDGLVSSKSVIKMINRRSEKVHVMSEKVLPS